MTKEQHKYWANRAIQGIRLKVESYGIPIEEKNKIMALVKLAIAEEIKAHEKN